MRGKLALLLIEDDPWEDVENKMEGIENTDATVEVLSAGKQRS